MKNGIAVGEELQHRHIKKGVYCITCGRDESLVHRFWTCPYSMHFWKKLHEITASPRTPIPQYVSSHHQIRCWLLDWLGKASDAQKSVMLQALYQLWLARNEVKDGERICSPDVLARRVAVLVEEWSAVHEQRKAGRPSLARERWLPPDNEWIKANADGASTKTRNKGGGGAVLRDHNGEFVAGSCLFFPSEYDPELSEIKACRRAMQLSMELGLDKIILKMDSQVVYGPMIEEIKGLLKTRDAYKVRWARCWANGVAHILAKEGCGYELCKTWLHVTQVVLLML